MQGCKERALDTGCACEGACRTEGSCAAWGVGQVAREAKELCLNAYRDAAPSATGGEKMLLCALRRPPPPSFKHVAKGLALLVPVRLPLPLQQLRQLRRLQAARVQAQVQQLGRARLQQVAGAVEAYLRGSTSRRRPKSWAAAPYSCRPMCARQRRASALALPGSSSSAWVQ